MSAAEASCMSALTHFSVLLPQHILDPPLDGRMIDAIVSDEPQQGLFLT